MGFFSRLATFFHIKANAALDKAEDPGQVMDYSYSKQVEQLQQLRRSIADVVTNEKRLEMQQAQLIQKTNTLDQQEVQAQVKINETVTGISEEMTEMNLAMQRAQDKVLTMQARANAMEALIEQGTLGEQGLPGGSGDTLERELQKISTEQNVEAQLQAMKQQLQLGGANVQQKQLESHSSNDASASSYAQDE